MEGERLKRINSDEAIDTLHDKSIQKNPYWY
jgi:hypothetical protein